MFTSLLLQRATAAETEPNNTSATANTLAYSGSNSGKINSAGDIDWWKVTTTADGRLDVTLTPLSGRYTWVYIYDKNGTTLLNSQYSTGTFTLSQDGLAAGTYYLKVNTYYGTDTGSYNISNTLVQPADANDVEPNNSRAQAKVLPLGGNRTGHVGYYQDNTRDTADWWQVTTTADGQLNLTLTPGNGEYVWIYLFDNNGTTLLYSQYSAGTFTLSQNGLAAGTYYLRVNCYYNNKFAPYKLSSTLTQPTQTNDAESNNTQAQALSLGVNATTTGHIGYYYNNIRDTFDWYKVTIPEDGMVALTLTPANGEYVWAYLFDNNGTTLLNSSYSTGKFTINTDGLAAGTYYVRVNCYYSSKFAPYTLTDSLKKYTNKTDVEPNGSAYQAKTLLANQANSGHVGFYYNNKRDTADWHKINYTGKQNGTMTVTLNFEAPFTSGYKYTYMTIYKDTNAAPLFNPYTNGGVLTANLTALSAGYYWVKIRCYYAGDFQPYSITPTFTQNVKAAIAVQSTVVSTTCDSANSITFKCSKSKAPYRVQLYRNGVVYGALRTVSNAANFTYTNLPNGVYYATVFGDGATGNAFGRSANVALVPVPTNLRTTGITGVQARLNWNAVSCAKYFSVQYRKATDTAWITRNTNGNTTFLTINNLTGATKYYWRVASADSANNVSATGTYADSITFTTAAALVSNVVESGVITKSAQDEKLNIRVFPNPVTNAFTIQLNNGNNKVSLMLRNMNNTIVWSRSNVPAASINNNKIDVTAFANGLYILEVKDHATNETITTKIAVAK